VSGHLLLYKPIYQYPAHYRLTIRSRAIKDPTAAIQDSANELSRIHF
jgi:hypothetical protein